MKHLLNCFLLGQGVATSAFVVTSKNIHSQQTDLLLNKEAAHQLFSSPQDEEEVEKIQATSFAEAGKSIIDEQDKERMEAMGDFDENPNVSLWNGSTD